MKLSDVIRELLKIYDEHEDINILVRYPSVGEIVSRAEIMMVQVEQDGDDKTVIIDI